MALLADTIGSAPPAFLTFLRAELAPRPGRLASVARITFCCVLVVVIAMVFRIPDPAVLAYLVFVLTREEAASTLLAGVVALLGATIAAALSLTFYMVDAAEPAVRLALMAGSTFLGMFLVRTSALGPLAFMASFILVMSQKTIDDAPNLDAVPRGLLWLWVVVAIPVAVTVLVDLVIGEQPARLARRTALRLLGSLAAALRSGDSRKLKHAQAEALGLVALRKSAGMLDRGLRGRAAIDAMLIETLAEVLTLRRLLPSDLPIEVRLPLAEACEASAAAFEHTGAPLAVQVPRPADADLAELSPQVRPVVVAMAGALARLCEGMTARRAASDAPAARVAKSILVADAFSNPNHTRFALKTTMAVMMAYITYTLLDWPGISTAVTTCFFVAQGSVGETMHKLTLRISGALLGGLVGALTIVFVVPEMDDIGQLCLLISTVSLVCAWVATSSELLAYAGKQMAFAFFMGVLQGYGPPTDLTVLKDRVAGILLGNVIMSVVFSVVWPATATDRALSSLAAAFRTLGQLLSDPAGAKAGARLAVIRALAEARRFVAIAAFEQPALPGRGVQAREVGLSLGTLDQFAGATFTVVEQTPQAEIAGMAHRQDAAAAAWFIACADRLARGEFALVAPDVAASSDPVGTNVPEDAPVTARAAIEARALLQAEMEHAVAIRT